jgi:hypothetical protein
MDGKESLSMQHLQVQILPKEAALHLTLYSGPAVNMKSAKNVSSATPVFLSTKPCTMTTSKLLLQCRMHQSQCKPC